MFTLLSLHLPDGGNLSRSHPSTAKLKSITIHRWLKQKRATIQPQFLSTWSTLHKYFYVRMWSRTHACILSAVKCVCTHLPLTFPFSPSLCLTGPRLLPSSSLSRRISLLSAATWSSLTEREGLKDSLISTQIKRHFRFHPTRRLAGARRTQSLCVFS